MSGIIVHWSNSGLSLMIVQDRRTRELRTGFLLCTVNNFSPLLSKTLLFWSCWNFVFHRHLSSSWHRRVYKDITMLSLVLSGFLQTLWKHGLFFPESLSSNNHKRGNDITKFLGTKVLEGTTSAEYHMSASVCGQKLRMQWPETKSCDKATFMVEHPELLIERS